VDLFVVRGYSRKHKGQLLRAVPKGQRARSTEHEEESNSDVHSSTPPTPQGSRPELALAYQGLDGSVMESRIEFVHLQPDYLKGYTAVWQLELGTHETQKLGYRLQMLTNKSPYFPS
jgi:hypothetical protein